MAIQNKIPFDPVPGRVNPQPQERPGRSQKGAAQKPDFQELLRRASREEGGVSLSRHVQDRLQSREISIDSQQAALLDSAVRIAREKGIRDTLVLTPDAAFIVNVPNNTVVTAMERQAAAQRVFTNIDGAVVFS